jgi:hypothetical protein
MIIVWYGDQTAEAPGGLYIAVIVIKLITIAIIAPINNIIIVL